MPHNRFYSVEDFSVGASIVFTEKEHHHLRVQRINVDETIEVVNGKGALAEAVVTKILKESSSARIVSLRKEALPSPFITLAIPLMHTNKLDFIVEKGTELGADRFLFYKADHSEKEALSTQKLERIFTLSISSMKQSGRLFLPSFELIPSLQEVLRSSEAIFFGDPNAKEPLNLTPALSSLLFVSGPEKGFSSEEISLLKEKGKAALLSPYVLRAETAPLAAMSLLGLKKAFPKC